MKKLRIIKLKRTYRRFTLLEIQKLLARPELKYTSRLSPNDKAILMVDIAKAARAVYALINK